MSHSPLHSPRFCLKGVLTTFQGLVLVGASLQTSAYTVPHLVIGRVITGFGTGIDSSTVPMYQSELCRKEKRGRLVSWEVLFIGIGISFAYWLDFGMSYAGGAIAWRLPIAVQLIFALVVIILLFGLPESPRSVHTCRSFTLLTSLPLISSHFLRRLLTPSSIGGSSNVAAKKKPFESSAPSLTSRLMILTSPPKFVRSSTPWLSSPGSALTEPCSKMTA